MTNDKQDQSRGQSERDIAEAGPQVKQQQSRGQSKKDIAEAGPDAKRQS